MRGLDPSKPLFNLLKKGGKLNCLLEEIRNNTKDYFLGIRNECVNVYYMGGSLLRISCSGDKLSFKFNQNYINGSDELVPNNDEIEVDNWIKAFTILKSYIQRYQNGCNPNNKEKKEKKIQQEILMNNNSCLSAEYFITDIEYSCPGIAYGRFDYVAIKKNKDLNGKHRLALIELKFGVRAFGTSFKEENGNLKYGSGIVGHTINFSRFVFGVKTNNSFIREKVNKMETLEFLRRETFNILKNKSELKLLDIATDNIFKNIQENEIDIDDNNIETLLLCVCCGDEDKAKNTIRKYMGYGKKAKYNVNDLKLKYEISDKLKLKCLVTKNDVLDCLRQQQFIDLDI